MTYTFAGWGTYASSRATADWLMQTYHADVHAALDAQGHTPAIYPSWIDEDAPERGLRISAEGPRYSTGYGDFVGIPTVLVENHTMKPYKRRVLGTYVLLEQSLKTVAREASRIAAAKAQDRSASPARLMVRWERADKPLETIAFKGYRYDSYLSAVSGARERRWTGAPATIRMPVFGVKSTRDVALPRAWWLMPEQTALIGKLRAHGIGMEVQEAPRTLALEVARLANGKDRSPPQRTVETIALPAGAVRIAARQPAHLLAAALLEAESDDSFLANGWFDQALPPESTLTRHLLAPWADRMMETDAGLRAQFQSAVAGDPALAADPQARLGWWLARSPYFERSRWTYPVLSERD